MRAARILILAWAAVCAAYAQTGQTGPIGGVALAAGQCSQGTASVSGVTTLQAVSATPATYPGDSLYWIAYVSAPNVVTVKVCATIAVGPVRNSVYTVTVVGTGGGGSVTAVTATAPLTSSGGTTPNISATYQGSGLKVQASTGSTTTNDCVKFDLTGNTVDAGGGCGSPPGNVQHKNTSYAVTCADFTSVITFQATASVTFTLPSGCSPTGGWIVVLPGPGGDAAAFNLSTNSVTANGQSTLTTLAGGGAGTSGYPGYVLTPNPATSNDFIVRSTITPSGVTTQNVVTGSRAFGTVYQNTTGKPMFIGVETQFMLATTVTFYTDSSNPPTTQVAQNSINGSGYFVSLFAIVLPGNYYELTTSSAMYTAIVTWTEWY